MSSGVHPYTDDPQAGPYVVFPNHSTQILSNTVHLLGVSLLAACLSRRTLSPSELSLTRGWLNLPWSKICVMAVFVISWLFVFVAGILVNGIGLSFTLAICSSAIYICITLYALSKILIYCFLVERVHVVWSARNSEFRRDSLVYKVCLGILLVYIAVIANMFVGQLSLFQKDRACVIGLKRSASIPLLSYDLGLNVFLTGMFVWPLIGAKSRNRKFKLVARRTLLASAAALTTSVVNIAVLTIMGSSGELGWICLASCSSDAMLNAIVLFWITSPPSKQELMREHLSLPSLQIPVSIFSPQTPSFVDGAPGIGIPAPALSKSPRDATYSFSDHGRHSSISTHSHPHGVVNRYNVSIHHEEPFLLYSHSLLDYTRSERATPLPENGSPTDAPSHIHYLTGAACPCGRAYPTTLLRRVNADGSIRSHMPQGVLRPRTLQNVLDDLDSPDTEESTVEVGDTIETEKLPVSFHVDGDS